MVELKPITEDNFIDAFNLTLAPGQELFLYTDGVPEATNADKVLYGTDRMMEILNKNTRLDPQQLLAVVKEDVDHFVGDAPQFDDLTMLCVRYNGADDRLSPTI